MTKYDSKLMFCSETNFPTFKGYCDICNIRNKDSICYLYGEVDIRDIDPEKLKHLIKILEARLGTLTAKYVYKLNKTKDR